jgi:hypothetical protein
MRNWTCSRVISEGLSVQVKSGVSKLVVMLVELNLCHGLLRITFKGVSDSLLLCIGNLS